MRISNPRRKRYVVSVYHADDAVEFPMSDRLSIPLIRLFGGTVVAENDRMAAARVWINKVGQFRQQRLDALGDPVAIRYAEVDPHSVASQLIPSSLCPDAGGYMLDNLVEVWFISVREAL